MWKINVKHNAVCLTEGSTLQQVMLFVLFFFQCKQSSLYEGSTAFTHNAAQSQLRPYWKVCTQERVRNTGGRKQEHSS